MIVSIIIGRGGSSLYRKNLRIVNGNPLLAYPIMASLDSKEVDLTFFSTEDQEMKGIAQNYGAVVLDRDPELSTDKALGEDVFKSVYKLIKDGTDREIEFVLPLFANAVGLNYHMIDEMVKRLRGVPSADSICTLSAYPAFSPYRMRKIDIVKHPEAGIVDAWVVPFMDNVDWSNVDCDRHSGEQAYIYDCCCAVVRPRCIEEMDKGQPPQKWLGKVIMGYMGCRDISCTDIDEEWQFGQMKLWLDKHWIRS